MQKRKKPDETKEGIKSMKVLHYVIILSFSIFLNTTLAKDQDALYQIYKNARATNNYIAPDKKEFIQAHDLFKSLFTHKDISPQLEQTIKDLNFRIIKLSLNQKNLLILAEEKTHQTGRGFYIFWQDKMAQDVLQMPHSQKDLYTGEIGLSLFVEGNFAAGAWNTTARYYSQDGKKISADLADFSQSYFIAFSKAFALCHSQGYIIQLHGFSSQKRKTQTGKKSGFIISSGSWKHDRPLSKLDQCVEQKFSTKSSLYSFEINELGGTQNTIGIALRQMGHRGFVHLEINRSIRKKLLKSQSMREKLLKCIEGMRL